jgi:hypothetical protein
MSDRTQILSNIDQWENVRPRFTAACFVNAIAILTMNLVANSTDEDWQSIPLAAVFAVLGGVALSAIALFVGMAARWQTFQRRFVLPACACLLTAGLIGIAFSINETVKVERSPLGVADEQHPIIYLTGLACTAFAIVNWPTRPKLKR